MNAFFSKFFHWLKSAGSEADGTGSMKRIIAFILSLTYCYCTIRAEIQTNYFDKNGKLTSTVCGKEFDHFTQVVIAVMILLLLGLATVPQIMDALGKLRGFNPPPAVIMPDNIPPGPLVPAPAQVAKPDAGLSPEDANQPPAQ